MIQCLIVLLFHPSSEKDHRVRQCLTVFFPCFGAQSSRNQALLAEVFENVLCSILRPPHDSPLEDIPVMQIAQYFVYILAEATNELKLELVKCLLCQIVADPLNSNIRGVIKALSTVLCDFDDATILIVHQHVQGVVEKIEDAMARRNLTKWIATVPTIEEGSSIDTSSFKKAVDERTREVEEALAASEAGSKNSSEEDSYSGSDSE